MTGIQWTDETWNPTIGCRRVSEGCRHCYAEAQAKRIVMMQRARKQDSPYEAVVKTDSAGHPLPLWNGKAVFLPERLAQPLRWKKPRMVFVNSMSDLFHEDLDFEEIAAVFGVMAQATQHTFQVLTKRPERMLRFFDWLDRQRTGAGPVSRSWAVQVIARDHCGEVADPTSLSWPLPNVWLGVSAEDQKTADQRIPLLIQCPAAVRFVSAEPLLGGIEGLGDTWSDHSKRGASSQVRLDWVIVGGESGPEARECDADWVRRIVTECRSGDVACFVKQLGSVVTHHGITRPGEHWSDEIQTEAFGIVSRYHLDHKKGGNPDEWPEDLRVRQMPADPREVR